MSASMEPLPDIIEPRWWTGEPPIAPESFTIDCSVDVYDRFGIPINWKTGDIAIVCNWRWAHGRPGIHLNTGEQRELGVLIGEPFNRVGDLDGKW